MDSEALALSSRSAVVAPEASNPVADAKAGDDARPLLAPGIMGGGAGHLDVGALASGLLARLQSESEKKEVPIGPNYQVEVPEWKGAAPMDLDDAAAEGGEPGTPLSPVRVTTTTVRHRPLCRQRRR